MKMWVYACLGILIVGSEISPARDGTDSHKAQAIIESWVQMWNTFDIREVERLFCKCDELSYYSSEREGIIRGIDAVMEHHKGFGFGTSGTQRNTKLWLDDTDFSIFGSTAVVTAIWFFERDEVIQKGPVTIVLRRNLSDDYEIVHMNFSSY